MTYEADKLLDELDEYLDAIAPSTRKGSFIELPGEDGARLRFDFDEKTCVRSE